MSDQTKNEEWARDCIAEISLAAVVTPRDEELRAWELLRNEPPEPSIEQMREEWERDNEGGDDDDERY